MQDNKDILISALSNKIKTLREKEGKSISLISNEVGISKSIWSDLEKGIKDPQFSTLWKVAESLNLPLSKILHELEIDLKDKISFIENN